MYNAGDFNTTETVHLPFNTFSSDDPSASVTVTDLATTDIHIHKDGSATQRSSDAGVTVSINFDTVTGQHVVHIDLSDDTDAGFYAAGSRYLVRLEGITVDGATLNVWIGGFSIGCTLRPATAGRTLVVDANGLADACAVKVGPSGSGTAQTANDIGGDVNDILDDVTGLDGDAMRGTDSAALASVVGALADAAADGDPTESDTLMKYVKQLINILIGTAGIVSFPAEAAPGDTVSLAEVIRAIHADVTGLNGDAMRGTDGANTTTPPTVTEIQTELEENGASILDTLQDRLTATRAGYLDELGAANIPADVDAIKAVTDVIPDAGALTTIAADTARLTAARAGALTDLIDGGRLDLLVDAIKAKTDNLPEGIQKNQAFNNFEFLMVDSTDHRTPKTGLTVSGYKSIDGAAFVAVSGSIAEVANGIYQVDFAAADTNGDVITYRFTATGADDRFVTIKTTT